MFEKSHVFNTDCLEAMKKFPDSFFGLAIVDPPYFSGPEKRSYYGKSVGSKGIKRKKYPTCEWEVPTTEYFDELFRISKKQIIWGCNYYDFKFGPGRIVWDKVNDGTSFSDAEIAYCSEHDSVRMFRFMWNGMMQGKSINEGHIQQGNKKLNEKRIHQTQKPVLLYKWLIDKYAESGDIILDTHLGSGSARIAAYDLGYEFYGYELNPDHFNNQQKRFNEHTAQLTMSL